VKWQEESKLPEPMCSLNLRNPVFWSALLCLVPSLQAYQPRFTVEVSAQASAVYTLACLSHQIPCTRMKFQGRESQPAVAEWKAAFAAMPPIESDAYSYPFLPNTPALFPQQRRQQHILEALFDSRSAGELARQAHLDPALARKLWNALLSMRSTMPRMPSSLLTMRNASQKLLRDTRVSQLTQDIATLLNSSNANESIILHLIPSPDPTTDDATGTMIGRHVFVEITNFAKAEFGPSIAMHETIHYLYDSVSPETHRERMQMFLARSYPRASSFYTLFNEALAIASQRLLDIRMGENPDSEGDNDTYRDAYIPRAGNVLGPILEQWVSQRGRFDERFVRAYLDGCAKEFTPDLDSPRFLLVSGVFVASASAEAALDQLLSDLQSHSNVRLKPEDASWSRFTHAPLVLLGTSAELRPFWTRYPPIERFAAESPFIFTTMDRGAGIARPVIVLGGSGVDTIRAAAKELLSRTVWDASVSH
jgi:hypothetical protein